MKERFEAPAHLSDRSKRLWAELVPRRARSTGRLALLQAALEALDRAEQARSEVSTGKLTTTTETTGAVHVHPLVKVEREARQQFARIWSDLGLSFDAGEDGTSFERWHAMQTEENVKRSVERDGRKWEDLMS
jgi:P27 family predicted phage terminase small subunit